MSKNFYLSNFDESYLAYKLEVDCVIDHLKKHITKNQENELLKKKLQIYTNNFNEAQYLQSACELSVSYFIARKFPCTFKYELEVNPPKDVDCVFYDDGFQFNLEVKCADFTANENKKNQAGLHIITLGRYSDIDNLQNCLSSIALGSEFKSISRLPNLDNKLKDFLVSSHEKFQSNVNVNELNVLIVCCDNAEDMQRWYSYLFCNQGLFTENSFVSPSDYNNVDVIILSNIYHRHKNYQTKDKIKNHWKFENSFNIFLQNPYSLIQKNDAIKKLLSVIPNYNNELSNYNVPCHESEYGKHDAIKISYFIYEQLTEKGIYFFQPDNS